MNWLDPEQILQSNQGCIVGDGSIPLWWFSGKQIRGLLAEDWVDRISNADPGLEHGARSSGIPSHNPFSHPELWGNFNSGTASLRRIPIQVVIFVPESQVFWASRVSHND